jgi:hypothetical protein
MKRPDHYHRIGYDRRIKLEWVDLAAQLLLEGCSEKEIEEQLLETLKPFLSVGKSKVNRGSGEKAKTILMKTWVRVPANLVPLRNEGISIIESMPRHSRLPVHWGMTIAAYPFWGAVASNVGRVLRLQKTITLKTVSRRVGEQYGERSTAVDSARRVMMSMLDWGVIQRGKRWGTYSPTRRNSANSEKLVSWLFEALMWSQGKMQASVDQLKGSPVLFPFKLPQISGRQIAATSDRLEHVTHGLNQELLVLHD